MTSDGKRLLGVRVDGGWATEANEVGHDIGSCSRGLQVKASQAFVAVLNFAVCFPFSGFLFFSFSSFSYFTPSKLQSKSRFPRIFRV
jgi:hypothetical protein